MIDDEAQADGDQNLATLDEQLKWFEEHMPKPREADEAYLDALKSYEVSVFSYPKLDPAKVHRLEKSVIGDGAPRVERKGQKLNWISGLPAFCDHSGSDVISTIVEEYTYLTTDLYEIAMDLVEEFNAEMAHDRSQNPDLAKKRGAYLAPNLIIHDREYLSPKFIAHVLRPYFDACRRALHLLFSKIKQAHISGQFTIIARDGDRSYGIVLPGDGFDRRGSYKIPRESYLTGFHYSEDEIDRRLLQGQTASFDPLALRFLTSDQLPEFCFRGIGEAGRTKRAGRPKGTSLDIVDAPILQKMHDLLSSGLVCSIAEAARQVYVEDLTLFSGPGTPESKMKRLTKKYAIKYPKGE
jgi:hypothetical protein